MAAETGKLPYMQFHVSDWLSDTATLSPATKGIWIDLLALMHIKKTGTITGTLEKLARACRCSTSEMEYAIHELKSENVADIEACYGNVTEEYSITCRRMKRAENERVRARESMKKTRALQKCYANVTEVLQEKENKEKEKVSPTPPLKEKENKEIYHTQTGESAHAHTREENYPKSADDILRIAASPLCGISISRELAEEYYLLRSAADWVDGARRKVSVGSIPANLKRWYLNKVQANSPRVVVREPGPF